MIKINDYLKLNIEEMDNFGRGIAKVDSFVIFVFNALKGETVKAKVINVKKHYGEAIAEEIIKSSSKREKPKCPYYTLCGGCDLLNLSYEEEINYKKKKVEEVLKKEVEIIPTKRINYRNKLVLHVKEGKIGLFQKNTHSLVPINECLMSDKKINEIIKRLNNFKSLDKIEEIMIRAFDNVMMNVKGNISSSDLIKDFSDLFSVYLNNSHIYGEEYIETKFLNLIFRVTPLSFFQVNIKGMEELYKEIKSFLKLDKKMKLLDLYSGVGTISLYLAHYVKEVVGIEVVESAVEMANINKKINNISNVTFIKGKVEDNLRYLKDIDTLVVDPPRKGLDKMVIDILNKLNLKEFVYVSCNLSTFKRDLLLLDSYEVKKIKVIDMFPGTYHVETVALLSKLDVDKHINIEIELDELDLTSAESKATYAQIKEYVWNKFQLKVPTLYIAQIKRKCGIELREHYNKSKKEKQIIPQCTPEKEEAIMDALRHFKMI